MQDSHPGSPAAGKVSGPGVLNELRRTQAAIGVALALLDELLQPSPRQDDGPGPGEIRDVLLEIRNLAEAGLRAVRTPRPVM